MIKCTSLQPSLSPPGKIPSERIRWARYTKNMTIKQVAEKAGLREPTVSRAENSKTIDIATLKKLSVILDQPLWWLGCFEQLPEESLAQRIRKCRLYHGLTKKEFAGKLGVNEKTIRLWENDKSIPVVESLKLLNPYFPILSNSTQPQMIPSTKRECQFNCY